MFFKASCQPQLPLEHNLWFPLNIAKWGGFVSPQIAQFSPLFATYVANMTRFYDCVINRHTRLKHGKQLVVREDLLLSELVEAHHFRGPPLFARSVFVLRWWRGRNLAIEFFLTLPGK